jgi:hypothetical protein
MRETFESVEELIQYYLYVKASVLCCPTLLPKKNANWRDKFSATAAQSSMEEKHCFIADVEKMVRAYYYQQRGYRPIPYDCLNQIWELRFCKKLSFGQIARHFRSRIRDGHNVPGRLRYRENLHGITQDMREMADGFFIERGYVVEKEVRQA